MTDANRIGAAGAAGNNGSSPGQSGTAGTPGGYIKATDTAGESGERITV